MYLHRAKPEKDRYPIPAAWAAGIRLKFLTVTWRIATSTGDAKRVGVIQFIPRFCYLGVFLKY
jgi:hypothetical protein